MKHWEGNLWERLIAMRRILAGLLLLLSSSGANAALIAYWNFDNYTDTASATTIPASAGVGTLAITGFPDGDLFRENGTTTNETIPADLLTNDALQLRNPAGNNGDYLQLAFSLTGFQDPVLTYVTKKSDLNGYDINQWSYSTDGGTSFTNFGAAVDPVTIATTSWTGTLVTRDFTGVGALTNQTSVILRYTFNGGSGAAARNAIDNIQINATTVPEPSTCALLSLGLFGLVLSRRRSLGSPARS